MTLLDDPRPISADSHALEGPEVFEGLAERFGDDAPRVVTKEGRGDLIVIPNIPNRSRNVAYRPNKPSLGVSLALEANRSAVLHLSALPRNLDPVGGGTPT